MSRSLKMVGVTVVLAGLLAVGGSYAVGVFFKKDFQERVERANRWLQTRSIRNIGVQVESYDSGLFSATARTRVTLESETMLTVKHDIRHGLGTGLASFGTIHSEVELPQGLSEVARALFGGELFEGKAPFTVDSAIGWTGGKRLRIESPRFAGKARGVMGIDWGGIDGEITMDSGHKNIAWRIEAPGLSMTDGKNKVEIGRLYTTGDTVRPGTRYFRVGQMELGLDKFVAHMEEGKLRRDFPDPLEMENLKLSSDIRENGETIDSALTFSIGKSLTEEVAVDEAKWTFAVENLDADALDTLTRIIETSWQEDGKTLADALKGQESTLASALLRHKPVIALKEASLRLAQGEFRASARVSYIGENLDLDRFDPERDLAIDVECSVSRTLLAYLIGLEASKQMAIGDAQTEEALKAFATQFVDQQINELMNKGIFVEKDGLLIATLHFQDKTLTLNGKPWNEEEAGGLFSGRLP
ncbi:MAG: YdgA family protein [Zoogloeaceae bacterium]|nr:YdgA family protein [Zoogloeaceae bacterium]